MKAVKMLPALMLALLLLTGCGSAGQARFVPGAVAETSNEAENEEKEEGAKDMKLRIGDTQVAVRWEENEAADALRELVREKPLSISMSMYGGFEQVGSIGQSLPRNDIQITTGAGDIVLYSGNQIVVFYGSNSWSYTRLGHITDQDADGMRQLLGHGDVTVEISAQGAEQDG